MFKSEFEDKLDAEILALLNELDGLERASEKYNTLVERIAKLEKLKPEPRLNLPSMDTVLLVGANIFGIIWLARFEKEGPIRAQNAMRFVIKLR